MAALVPAPLWLRRVIFPHDVRCGVGQACARRACYSRLMASRVKSIFPRSGHDHDSCVADALKTAERLCEAADEQLTPLRRRVLELVWEIGRAHV